MHPRGILFAALGAASLTSLAPPVGAEGETEPPPDPAVIAEREARAAADEPIATDPPLVQDDQVAPPEGTRAIRDLYYLDATSTSGGYIRVFARDNPAQDKPGIATTTLRIYGNAAAFRNGPGPVKLHSSFTCTGAGIDGLSVGSGGVSVSGGWSSKTLTWTSYQANSSEVRQYYTEGGHFRCKASNLSLAQFTRDGTATTSYKDQSTRAQDSYSFTW